MNLMSVWTQKLVRQAAGDPPSAAPADPAPTAPAAPDYSFLPPEFVVDGKPDAEGFTKHLAALTEKSKPRAPEDGAYDLSLPADLKFDAEGFEPKLDLDNPEFAPVVSGLKDFLKSIDAPKEAGPAALGLLAQYQAAQYQAAVKALEAEMTALGPQAQTRIETVSRSLETLLPKDEADAMRGTLTSAKGIAAMERLLSAKGLSSPTPNPAAAEPDPLAARYPTTAARR